MKLRLLVVALIAVLGTGCATTDKSGLAGYKIKPDSTVRHGAPDAQSFYQLARFYHGQKRYEKAEMAYIKAIALDGGRVDSYNALGSLYAERGDLERAIGDLAGFASALILGLVALGIAVESVLRFLNPQPVAFSEATAIAVLGLLVNLLSAVLLGPDHHHDHHHEPHDHAEHGHDNNLRSAYVHVLADALTSVLAIAALLGGRLLGWVWLDPAMGLVGAAVIAVWSWSLMRAASSVLLDMADPHVEGEIRELVEDETEARIVDLHLWRVGPAGHAAIVSVVGDDADNVRRRLRPVHEIVHLTVEARASSSQPPAA